MFKFLALQLAFVFSSSAFAMNCTDFSGTWESAGVCGKHNVTITVAQSDCDKVTVDGQDMAIGQVEIPELTTAGQISRIMSWDASKSVLTIDVMNSYTRSNAYISFAKSVGTISLTSPTAMLSTWERNEVIIMNGVRREEIKKEVCNLNKK